MNQGHKEHKNKLNVLELELKKQKIIGKLIDGCDVIELLTKCKCASKKELDLIDKKTTYKFQECVEDYDSVFNINNICLTEMKELHGGTQSEDNHKVLNILTKVGLKYGQRPSDISRNISNNNGNWYVLNHQNNQFWLKIENNNLYYFMYNNGESSEIEESPLHLLGNDNEIIELIQELVDEHFE